MKKKIIKFQIQSKENKENKDATDKARLKESYHYLISYYFIIVEDKATAQQYAQKMLQIDPENQIAKQVMETK